MNRYENQLIIKEEIFQNGFFPKIPNFEKYGSAFVLTQGCDDDILITDRTTVKQIRKGKYTLLVEISTVPYRIDIRFASPSREASYTFDVNIKAVIQVKDPIRVYENRNLDIHIYFEALFLQDVKKITRCYSILDYNGMDEELTKKLSSYNTFDVSTGFSYTISGVDVQAGEQAKKYVDEYSKRQLDAGLKIQARQLAQFLTKDYGEAIMTEVIEGKRSEADAIIANEQYEKANSGEQLKLLEDLLKKGFITDSEARSSARMAMKKIGVERQLEQRETCSDQDADALNLGLNSFYTDED